MYHEPSNGGLSSLLSSTYMVPRLGLVSDGSLPCVDGMVTVVLEHLSNWEETD